MKRIIAHMVNTIIFVTCFLFILFSFFKVISYSFIDKYVYYDNIVLITVWAIGILIAIVLTRPLYRWILHLRYL